MTSTISGSLRLPGVELAYRVVGHGPPLLLVHGYGGAGSDWDRWVDDLARVRSVVIPDLRGHGRSTNPSARFTHREAAGDLLALADALGLGSFDAVGFSAGGIALLHAAVMAPDRVRRLVVIGGAHRLVPASREALRRYPALDSLPGSERQRYLQAHPGGHVQIEALLAQFRGVADNVDDFQLSARELGTIAAPTLLMFGERDGFYPPLVIEELQAWLPDATLRIVPAAGHMALWPECGGSEAAASAFAGEVVRFLDAGRGAG